MQFLKTLLVLLFAALISAAAFPQDPDAAVEAGFTGLRTKQSADGKQYTFSIYEGGKLESTIVVVDDPAAPDLVMSAFDASGAQVNGASLDAAGATANADSPDAQGPCSKACRIWKFIRKHGRRAIRFIACLGNKIPASCWFAIFGCMVSPNPWMCFEGILCSAGPIRACVRA
ncbi:unnamed protein product [Tuber aestivum]|uniref:Uncharacterized protein n=1 Tax=Tuber aestivum TaxID=59557 RepID=A0A292Q0P0_9PEZI|nr:unnamed protein product [Tuber aestivum]